MADSLVEEEAEVIHVQPVIARGQMMTMGAMLRLNLPGEEWETAPTRLCGVQIIGSTHGSPVTCVDCLELLHS